MGVDCCFRVVAFVWDWDSVFAVTYRGVPVLLWRSFYDEGCRLLDFKVLTFDDLS